MHFALYEAPGLRYVGQFNLNLLLIYRRMSEENPLNDHLGEAYSHDGSIENIRLNSALAAAGIGTWVFDVLQVEFWICERFKNHVNFSGDNIISYPMMLNFVDKNDKERLDRALRESLKPGSDGILDIECRVDVEEKENLRWLHWKGQAFFNRLDDSSSFSGIIQDVTSEVLNREILEQSESNLKLLVASEIAAKKEAYEAEGTLRETVELAELGSWHIDLLTGIIDCSKRMKLWLGIEEEGLVSLQAVYESVSKSDQPMIKAMLPEALNPEGDGLYDAEFTVEASDKTEERILHARGKVFFDKTGTAVKISGSTQDVTQQRKIELALSQQVRARTSELQVANNNLATVNKEYLTANDELERSNKMLNVSNRNLEQFAYIASHDLQEPLSKIQSFGEMLKTRYAEQLGEGSFYVERMQAAAKRMSGLIEDLLSFSRATVAETEFQMVSLTEVVKNVLVDLELVVARTGALIRIDALPTIKGDSLQLGQLFQNLLSNALKFQLPGTTPVIKIEWRIVKRSRLPENVMPNGHSIAYDCIQIIDNGIGFDEKHTQRIFQVFQRLHGKSEYAGTGIGLAICEKVVRNHSGAITAKSQQGKGSTFSIYFPIS